MNSNFNQINFNKLEYNLYELLGLQENCSIEDVKKQYRKIIKKFHPDKTELEEKIYLNINIAYKILSHKNTKESYNEWLHMNLNDFNNLKASFKSNKIEDYFPKDKKEASIGFSRDSEILLKRHGTINVDNRNFNIRCKDKKVERENIRLPNRENFRNTDHFNNDFENKKINGEYSDKIIKYENDKIIPYQHSKKGLHYVDLRDFNKLYVEDTVETADFTSLNRAFGLQPVMKETRGDNISTNIAEYKKVTEDLNNLNINI